MVLKKFSEIFKQMTQNETVFNPANSFLTQPIHILPNKIKSCRLKGKIVSKIVCDFF
jgi:hypothetical protein